MSQPSSLRYDQAKAILDREFDSFFAANWTPGCKKDLETPFMQKMMTQGFTYDQVGMFLGFGQ